MEEQENFYWLMDENEKSEYYSNEFMFCPVCNGNYHIQDIQLFNSETVTIKCKCGSFTKGLEELINISTFYLHKNFEKNNFLFGNKTCSKPVKIDLSNHNCSHGSQSISYCHECSQYLCSQCLQFHKKHLCYDENLLGERDIAFPHIFKGSLSLNYEMIIKQLDLAIKQLLHDKEEIEKSYQENVKKNNLLEKIINRLFHNYRLTRKSNFINYLNYYNYSYDNELFKISDVLTCENVHTESIKFIDYCKNNFVITLPHKQNNKITFIRNIISQEKEIYENEETELMIKKAPGFEDIGYDSYGMHIWQSQWRKNEITEVDPYEHNFNINVPNERKNEYLEKYEMRRGFQINQHYETDFPTKLKFFVLNDYTLAVVMTNWETKIVIFSLSTLQEKMSIPIKQENLKQDQEQNEFNSDENLPIKFHCLSDGTILYYYRNVLNRIIFDSSTTYKIDTNILKGYKIDYIVELSNKEILIGLDKKTLYFVQNSVPFLIKRKMYKKYLSFCEISDSYLLFSNEGSYLVNLNTNDKVKKFPKLIFKKGIRLEKRKKVLLINISALYIFDTISLSIETKISLQYKVIGFCIEPIYKEFGYFTNIKKQCMKIDLTTLKYKKIDFSPEQKRINRILLLPKNRLLVQTGLTVKIFQNHD